MKSDIIIINSADNAGVAIREIPEGAKAVLPDGTSLTALNAIPYGHKIALRDIKKGEDVIKYGHGIGKTKNDLKKGEWIHIHNMIILEEE